MPAVIGKNVARRCVAKKRSTSTRLCKGRGSAPTESRIGCGGGEVGASTVIALRTGLAPHLSDRAEQRQARGADVRAYATLDARIDAVAIGEPIVFALRCLKEPRGVDACRTC